MQSRHFHEKKGLARFVLEVLMILILSLGSFSPVFAQDEVTPEASETPTEVSTEITPTETATELPTVEPTIEITPTVELTATETATEEPGQTKTTEGITPTIEANSLPVNDLISNAITMNLNVIYTDNTSLATISSSADGANLVDPVNVCNSSDTGSVWYQFTAPSTGVYTIDAYGSDYKPNLTVLRKVSSTSRTPVVCGNTGDWTDEDYYKLSFNATAGYTYLIGVSDSVGGGNLSLKMTKETCPIGYLCGAGVEGDGARMKWANATILDSNGSYIGYGATSYSGFIQIYLNINIKSGSSYRIITKGNYSVATNTSTVFLTSSNYYSPTAVGNPRASVVVKNTEGEQIGTDQMVVIGSSGGYFLSGTPESGARDYYMPAGTYSFFASCDADGIEVYKNGYTLTSTNAATPLTVILDASTLAWDTFTIDADGSMNADLGLYSPEGYGLALTITDDRVVTLAAPVGTQLSLVTLDVIATDDSSMNWDYFITLENNAFSINGGKDHSYQVGGGLSVSPYVYNVPLRLDEGYGEIHPGVYDAHGNYVNQIEYYGNASSSGQVADNTITGPELYQKLSTYTAEDGTIFRKSVPEIASELNGQNWVDRQIYPTYTLTNSDGSSTYTPTGYQYLGRTVKFDLNPSSPTGTWTLDEVVDLGPYGGGTRTGSFNFDVYSISDHKLDNDDFANATVLDPSKFSITEDTKGATTAKDDPKIPIPYNIDQGIASTWFKYVAPSDGLLTVDTKGSDYNTVLNIWQGVRGKLINKTFNDDYCSAGTCISQSQATVSVVAGQIYYIEVTQYKSSATSTSAQSIDGEGSPQGDIEAQQIGGSLTLNGSQVNCYSLNAVSNNTAYGTVNVSPAPNCLGTKYSKGTEITVKALPKATNGFLGWSDPTITSNPNIFTISEDTAIRANFVALGKPTQSTPAAGYVTNEVPTLAWKAVNYADHYQVQVSKVSTFATLVEDESLDEGVLTFTTTKIAADGQYYWRVRAVAASGDAGPWSASRTFTFDKTAPAAPKLSAPVNGVKVRGTPNYTWSVPVGAKAYLFAYDNDADLASPVYTSGILTKSNFVPPLQATGTYYWHVKAQDAAGNWSDWSDPRMITITPAIPTAPVLTAPTTGSYFSFSPDLSLSWKPVNYAEWYEVQVSLISNFGTKLVDEKVYPDDCSTTDSGTICSISITDSITENHLYYWRVMAFNTYNEKPVSGPWSASRTFTYDTIAPDAPKLSAPADGAPVGGTPTYTWSVPAGAKTYIFEYADNPDFNEPTIYGDKTPLTSAKILPSLQAPGTYYWHVMAIDAAGNPSKWSDPRTITITPLKPAAPMLTSPAANVFINTAPTLTWGTVNYADRYMIQLSRVATFIPAVNIYPTDGMLSKKVEISEEGLYYWHVCAINSEGLTGPWSTARTFTYDVTAPDAPTLKSPLTGTAFPTSKVTLAVNAVTGVKSYEYQVSKDSGFGSNVVKEIKASTSYAISTPLDFGTYYWRVQSVDAAGNHSGWSSANSFDVTFLKAPLNYSTSTVNKPVFTWQAVPGALQYEVDYWLSGVETSTVRVMFTAPATSYTFLLALPNGTYQWHMKVQTASGWSEWTPTWQFTINH